MKYVFYSMTLITIFISCQNNAGYAKAEDAQDAGREFIRACLDGNYDKALFFLLKDSTDTNVMLLDKWKKDYARLDEEDKVNLKEASIIALQIEQVNDSTVQYVYTNSAEIKDTTTIKIVKINDDWLVDLKDIH
ncbi:MAG: hypothetical protein WKF97_21615 [Chitinophagaceae bacterium]